MRLIEYLTIAALMGMTSLVMFYAWIIVGALL